MKKFVTLLILISTIILLQCIFSESLLGNNLEFTKVQTLFNNGEFVVNIKNYDSTNCVLLTDHGGYAKIYISFDGGLNWNMIYSNYKKDLIKVMDIAYPKNNNIFVLYDSYLIIKYDDNGIVLDSMILGFEPDKQQVAFRARSLEMLDSTIGIACIKDKIVYTNNGWKTHKKLTPDSTNQSYINTVSIQDKFNFCGINTKSYYYKTTDGGNSFNNSPLTSSGTDIKFINSKIGFILGSNRLIDIPLNGKPIIHKTTNSGNSWEVILDTIIEPRNYGSGRIEMINESVGTFVESRGTVVTTVDGFTTFERIYLDGLSDNSSSMSITYSGNRPIIAASNLGIFTIIPDTILINMSIPELIEPPDKNNTMTTDINFKWRNAQGILQYVFHLSSNADFTDTLRLDTLDHNPLQTEFQEYFVKELIVCNDYYWRVASFKEGRTKWSIPFSFNTGKIPVTQIYPENNAIEIDYDTDVYWEELNGVEKYHLQTAYDNQFDNLFFSQDTLTSTFHRLEKLPVNKEIYWRVRGYCFDGYGDWSQIWKFKTKVNVSVNDYRESRLLYPNPAGNFITLSESDTKLYTDYEIYDISGRLLQKSILSSFRIDISGLERGSYYLRLLSPSDIATAGFLKME